MSRMATWRATRRWSRPSPPARTRASSPPSLAEALSQRAGIVKAEPAGPGFVNITLDAALLRRQLPVILAAGADYGKSRAQRGRINVEYVSANPTGPLHVGHCRGAVVGDALANLLAKAGYNVTKEYYINDAGAQVIALARSVYVRYLEALGRSPEAYIATVPGGMQYGGAYLLPIGAALADGAWRPLRRCARGRRGWTCSATSPLKKCWT